MNVNVQWINIYEMLYLVTIYESVSSFKCLFGFHAVLQIIIWLIQEHMLHIVF